MSEGQERIGVIGLGRMGQAMAGALSSAGWSVTGWNRSPLSADTHRQLAAVATVPQLSALVAQADVVILSLFDDAAVADVMEQLLALELRGRLVVDTSTVRPDTLAAFHEQARVAGAALVDAPISGGPEMVRARTAGIFLGGADADVERFLPVANVLAGSVRHLGPLGSGAAMKVVNNMLLMGCWQTLKEAVQVGRRAGLGAETLLDTLLAGPAANPAMRNRRDAILGLSEAVGFPVSGVLKDATVFMSVARDLGVPTPAIDAALTSFRDVAEAGFAANDLAAMAREALKQP